jgi:hypothetical protein
MTNNHPLYIRSKEELSRTAREIVNSHPFGYWGGIIRGPRERGKSAFCMHICREIYQFVEGLPRDSAWERVLENTLFTLDEIDNMFSILDTITWENVLDWQRKNTFLCKIWDDAGMHGGKFKYFTDVKVVEHLQGNMDVIRFILTGFLINTPQLEHLLGFLRNYKDHKVINVAYPSEGKHLYNRVATTKIWKEDRLGRWHLVPSYVTRFSCFIDDWVYEEYSRMKARAIVNNQKRFQDMVNVAKKMPNVRMDEVEEEIENI